MIQEYETIELKTDLPKYGLHEGDKGTVVMVHGQGEGYEVEFFDQEGDTLVIVTCLDSQIRRRSSDAQTREIMTRTLEAKLKSRRLVPTRPSNHRRRLYRPRANQHPD